MTECLFRLCRRLSEELPEEDRGVATITAEFNKITVKIETLLSETEDFGSFAGRHLIVLIFGFHLGDIITYSGNFIVILANRT